MVQSNLFGESVEDDQIMIGLNSNSFFANPDDHILYLDYDNTPLKSVIMDIKRLQKTFLLPVMHVYKSSLNKNNFHVYCFVRVNTKKLVEIVMMSECCENFKKNLFANGFACLRVTPKVDTEEGIIHYIDHVKDVPSTRSSSMTYPHLYEKVKNIILEEKNRAIEGEYG